MRKALLIRYGLGLALLSVAISSVCSTSSAQGQKQSSSDEAFFDKQVLPVLQANCLKCHGAEAKIRGGLRLTSREEILKGGDSGPAVDLDKPETSRFLQAI